MVKVIDKENFINFYLLTLINTNVLALYKLPVFNSLCLIECLL